MRIKCGCALGVVLINWISYCASVALVLKVMGTGEMLVDLGPMFDLALFIDVLHFTALSAGTLAVCHQITFLRGPSVMDKTKKMDCLTIVKELWGWRKIEEKTKKLENMLNQDHSKTWNFWLESDNKLEVKKKSRRNIIVFQEIGLGVLHHKEIGFYIALPAPLWHLHKQSNSLNLWSSKSSTAEVPFRACWHKDMGVCSDIIIRTHVKSESKYERFPAILPTQHHPKSQQSWKTL